MNSDCSCEKVPADQEICPECFATVAGSTNRTCLSAALREVIRPLETPVVVAERHRAYEGFEQACYTPPTARRSGWSRLWILWSAAMLVVTCVGYGQWKSRLSERAQRASNQAESAFLGQRYSSALNLWDSALHDHRSAGNESEEFAILLAMSRCHIALDQVAQGKDRLFQASRLQVGEDSARSLRTSWLNFAGSRLEDSVALHKRGDDGNALLAALDARTGFTEGKAEPRQLAGADRMAARCCLRLQNIEGAQSYLHQAGERDPKNSANKALLANLRQLEARLAKAALVRPSQPSPKQAGRTALPRTSAAAQTRSTASATSSYPTSQRSRSEDLGTDLVTGFRNPSYQNPGYSPPVNSYRPMPPQPMIPQVPSHSRPVLQQPMLPQVPSYPRSNPVPMPNYGTNRPQLPAPYAPPKPTLPWNSRP